MQSGGVAGGQQLRCHGSFSRGRENDPMRQRGRRRQLRCQLVARLPRASGAQFAPAPRPGVAASRTVRGCLAPPGGWPSVLLRKPHTRAPSAQMASVQPCQSAGVFRCCGSVPAGGVLAARAEGSGCWSKRKRAAALHHLQLFCVTSMQGLEVVSP